MSWFDHQDTVQMGDTGPKKDKSQLKMVEIKLPGGTDFIKVNENCVKRVYDDDLGGPVVIIIDEAAELFMQDKASSEAAKEQNQLKGELESIVQSITQLGRSAAIHCFIATQRNGTNIVNGTIQNNCLADFKLPNVRI